MKTMATAQQAMAQWDTMPMMMAMGDNNDDNNNGDGTTGDNIDEDNDNGCGDRQR